MKQLAYYQFNTFKHYLFLIDDAFLYCGVNPAFFCTMLQCDFFVLLSALDLRLYKVRTKSERVFYNGCSLWNWTFANSLGGRTWLLIKSHHWMSVRFIHGYSHIWVTVAFVSIVYLQQKLSGRMIISLIQILTLIDSIWRDYMLVKALCNWENPLHGYFNVAF